jgi:proteasome lid subunit RPN8/RPN11
MEVSVAHDADDLVDVTVDVGVAMALLVYMRSFRHERGGVLLGQREGLSIRIMAAVFPPQLARARDFCAFDVNGIEVIHRALTSIAEGAAKEAVGTVIGWVHSHPGHGLFLSDTDVRTLGSWLQLDHRAIAVVVDPFMRAKHQIAWWDRRYQRYSLVYAALSADRTCIRTASSLAQAVSDQTNEASSWDIVTSRCNITIFPVPSDNSPGVDPPT